MEDETHQRELISAAFDLRLAPETVWSFDASHFDRDIERPQSIFRLGTATSVPAAPDLSKNYGGASYTFTHDEYDRLGTSLTSALTDGVTLRAALRHTLSENSGKYSFQLQAKGVNQTETTQGYSFLDWDLETAGIKHKATTGVTHDYNLTHAPYPNNDTNAYTIAGATSSIGASSCPSDSYYPLRLSGPLRDTEEWELTNIIVADRVELDDQWSILAGGTLARIDDTTPTP